MPLSLIPAGTPCLPSTREATFPLAAPTTRAVRLDAALKVDEAEAVEEVEVVVVLVERPWNAASVGGASESACAGAGEPGDDTSWTLESMTLMSTSRFRIPSDRARSAGM